MRGIRDKTKHVPKHVPTEADAPPRRNTAVLRVHRGPASPERVVVYGTTPLGALTEEITEFTVPPGHHLVSLKLGFHHSVATWVTLRPGQVLDLVVEDNVQAIAPMLQGGFLRFHRG